ncbi:hypothetical protein PIB30_021398 [Stylosanthes scabra]|uniref:Uncharacterized protein n=1 Tax=Stylosanthes scabra TaxID=79078 RepID=A0ABU6T8I9_9FABA|nr:hypothetical protein [Stylosanthes scabra]
MQDLGIPVTGKATVEGGGSARWKAKALHGLRLAEGRDKRKLATVTGGSSRR